MSFDRDRIRADIARLIHLDPADIGDDDNLYDLGLDSMRVMQLLMEWEAAGMSADFALFAEQSTLAGWWSVLEKSGDA